jgi:hypothetical protein
MMANVLLTLEAGGATVVGGVAVGPTVALWAYTNALDPAVQMGAPDFLGGLTPGATPPSMAGYAGLAAAAAGGAAYAWYQGHH